MKAAILGFGLEGKSLFSYLKKRGVLDITILDKDEKAKIPRGVKKILGKNYLKNLNEFDAIYRSPGIPYHLKEIQEVKDKVSSLAKVFFGEAKKMNGVVTIGITGSVGKTTTATLLYKILKKAKRNAHLVGNIGVSPLDSLSKLKKGSVVVMELSSFQLQDLNISPNISIVLEIVEEHLDKHESFREYVSAKSNIANFQTEKDSIIFFFENKYSRKIAEKSKAKKIPITLSDAKRAGFILKIPGEHDYKNAMAAMEAAKILGISKNLIIKAINEFRGIEHRIEFVREISGVRYYNNSKATNVGSALGGINAFSQPKIVLVGGYNKNLDLKPLVQRLKKDDIKFAIFFGGAKHELIEIANKTGLKKFYSERSLKEALFKAKKIAQKGEVVLLSPGTASFDEFKNYEDRGEKFKKWVRQLR